MAQKRKQKQPNAQASSIFNKIGKPTGSVTGPSPDLDDDYRDIVMKGRLLNARLDNIFNFITHPVFIMGVVLLALIGDVGLDCLAANFKEKNPDIDYNKWEYMRNNVQTFLSYAVTVVFTSLADNFIQHVKREIKEKEDF